MKPSPRIQPSRVNALRRTVRLSGDTRSPVALILCGLLLSLPAFAWRSSLYPEDWQPGFKDAQGRYLHDFSYAGYHGGEREFPKITGTVIDVTQSPYNADGSGVQDATAAIQRAIDTAGVRGGGIVYLPAGTFTVKPQGSNAFALNITRNGVILRGAGRDRSFIFNDQPVMRSKTVIRIAPSGSTNWRGTENAKTLITADLPEPTSVIPVADVAAFKAGDWVVVRADCTPAFIADHGMDSMWSSSLGGITYYRMVVSVDASKKTLTIDTPTRYFLKTRDNARVYKISSHLQEIGLEDFSIGMRENPGAGWGEEDYTTAGTGAYDVHASHAIDMRHTVNSWLMRVGTFRPSVNDNDVHLTSNCLRLNMCRFVTVDSCSFAKPQYEGGGGNGYLYILEGNECLIRYSAALHGRHNYDFKSMQTSGNVIYRCTTTDGKLASDFHMHLSASNLIDNMAVSGDYLEAAYRPYGTMPYHGQTTTQSVFWNTNGLKYASGKTFIVKSQQFGWGYVIGTRGTAAAISTPGGNGTEPIDFKEGEGTGDGLEPESLFEDQRTKRLDGTAVRESGATPRRWGSGLRVRAVVCGLGTGMPVMTNVYDCAGRRVSIASAVRKGRMAIILEPETR